MCMSSIVLFLTNMLYTVTYLHRIQIVPARQHFVCLVHAVTMDWPHVATGYQINTSEN